MKDGLREECKKTNRKKTETAINLVKLNANRKPQFFAKPNRTEVIFLPTTHP